jgi:hypothetical protein
MTDQPLIYPGNAPQQDGTPAYDGMATVVDAPVVDVPPAEPVVP